MSKMILIDRPRLQQACAVPYRLIDGQPEVCLITSSGSGKWSFPKGLIDPGETPIETALKEAYEEAGLIGRIVGEPLGYYSYKKFGNTLRVVVVTMEVVRSLDSWEEAGLRKRCWASPAKAGKLLQKPELRSFLELALDRLCDFTLHGRG